jgi:hypothetical protein
MVLTLGSERRPFAAEIFGLPGGENIKGGGQKPIGDGLDRPRGGDLPQGAGARHGGSTLRWHRHEDTHHNFWWQSLSTPDRSHAELSSIAAPPSSGDRTKERLRRR